MSIHSESEILLYLVLSHLNRQMPHTQCILNCKPHISSFYMKEKTTVQIWLEIAWHIAHAQI